MDSPTHAAHTGLYRLLCNFFFMKNMADHGDS